MAIKLEGGGVSLNGLAISGGFFCGFPYKTLEYILKSHIGIFSLIPDIYFLKNMINMFFWVPLPPNKL